jgi:tape measure domain-containing protein
MARKVIAEFDAIDGPFINKLRAIDASVTRFEVGTLNAFGRVEKGMNGLLGSAARLQNVSGLIAGGFGAGIATSYIDQATRIRRALKEAGDASQEGFEKAFMAAQRSLSGFEAFSQGVQRMRKATDGTFEDSVRNMETLNKLLVLGGKTTQERMSTMIQFSQALQANVLQGEELRSLRENAPIELVTAIAREAGGTIEDLKEFGSQGKLTAEIMIRALKSLEAEADLRMKNVTLTISEAATVLANAGIVAVEGFDKGLGLSRATIGALTGLAGILGENAEAAEMFGKAVQIAGAALLATFAGGKINAAIANTRAYGQSLRDTAVATRTAESAAATALVTAGQRETAIRRQISAMRTSDATTRQVANAYRRLEAAQVVSAAAASRYRAAADAAAAANARLAFSARAVAAAGTLMRGAEAVNGGNVSRARSTRCPCRSAALATMFADVMSWPTWPPNPSCGTCTCRSSAPCASGACSTSSMPSRWSLRACSTTLALPPRCSFTPSSAPTRPLTAARMSLRE